MTFASFLREHAFAYVSLPEYLTVAVCLCILSLLLYRMSRPKFFYIVRHGQTLLNQQHIKQGAEGALAPAGVLQAKALGTAFRELGLNVIYSSPYERAVQTAKCIEEITLAPIIITPLLVERRNASEVIGKKTDDPDVERIVALTEKSVHDEAYRYSDEETFTDLKLRAKKCLSFLAHQHTHTACVVTHHAFLQVLIATMLYDENLTEASFVKLAFYNYSSNGGITTCVYSPLRRFGSSKGWSVLGFNEIAQ